MSGPALKHSDSHALIHEAALGEAEELTELLKDLLDQGESNKALETAYVIIEHWETRTLQHATSEEQGLYKDLAKRSPQSRKEVIGLTRDHNLLRRLVKEMKEILLHEGICQSVLHRCQALILVDQIHNADEETLIADQHSQMTEGSHGTSS